MVKCKRANGQGFCYKIDNNPNRKNPYVYGFTTGWTDEGKPIKKILGYTTSKSKGLKELERYLLIGNTDFQTDLTWQELYEKWFIYKQSTGVSTSGLQHYKNAYSKTTILNSKHFSEITLDAMQLVINNSGLKSDGQKRIRILFSQLYQYAKILNAKTPIDFSKYLVVDKSTKSTMHKPFTNDEINLLWNNRNDFIDIILFMIYTGIRPNELFKITKFETNYFVTGSKTEAGMNRVIPIHKDITELYLDIQNKINKINNRNFYILFKTELSRLNIEHFPYDTRHTFATLWKLSKCDELARKNIFGHSDKDLTNNTYTHLDFDFLYKELNNVKFK